MISGILMNLFMVDKESIAGKLENTWARHIFNTLINSNSKYQFKFTEEMINTLKSKDSVII